MSKRTLGMALLGLLLTGTVQAARIADVTNTKHNLSASSSGTVKASTESQICVFCHTPHGSTPAITPLWNRKLSSATYTVYTSSSLDANAIQGTLDQPGGSSKLCLSCHDGTLAIGNVNVLNGQGSAVTQGGQAVTMTGTGTGGVMPSGSGDTSGYTRKLGVDLTNDHPISVTYTTALANRDGELRAVDANQKWPADGSVIGVRGSGYRPKAPLEPTGAGALGQLQCATCHDPHIRETDASKGNQKFLRLNRFQELTPTANYDAANDIVCLACHDKNMANGIWAYSAHANPLVATQTYTATAATQNEFPTSLPVWKGACLNCHDSHTVQGARRLLREGTDSAANPKTGGNAALEETCYRCHTDSAGSSVTPVTTVPNVKADFALLRHMPIKSSEQLAGGEAHDIGGNFTDSTFIDCTTTTNKCGRDFVEQRAKLGVGNLSNRHAECTDCHNPHRVLKFRDFRGNPAGTISGTPDAAGTHEHTDTASNHSNIASGVLRGTFGVEPTYGSASFNALPTSYAVKRGDPGASATANVTDTYVTREYQICLKCHSDYGYSDNNVYPAGNRPVLGAPGTPSGTNALTMYTNQAKEFQAPVAHQGEPLNLGSNAGTADTNFNNNNHRSWHPVVASTGRTLASRGITAANPWLPPWSNQVGSNTMYCTDCHGSSTTSATSVIPDGGENGNAWGPHGSTNNFVLKGNWDKDAGSTAGTIGSNTPNMLCFKCHDKAAYMGNTNSGVRTGFYAPSSIPARGNLHNWHNQRIGFTLGGPRLKCAWCHVAVPHGWKNKALLVNLNDVGEEAGQGVGSSKEVSMSVTADYYTQQPYYLNAKLKVRNFKPSGQWTADDCGSRNKTGTGLTTGRINSSNGQTSNLAMTGFTWMVQVCNNPP